MKQHIKVRAKYTPLQYPQVEIEILEQSHRCEEFGNFVEDGCGRFKFEDVTLVSCGCPDYYGSQLVFVRGDGTDMDNNKFSVPLEKWPEIKAAIIAYNKWGELR